MSIFKCQTMAPLAWCVWAGTTPAVPPPITRVPYPQTPATASAWVKAHGVAVAELARHNNLPRLVLVDLLRGRLRGHRGQAHRAAIVLGLKAEPGHQGVAA